MKDTLIKVGVCSPQLKVADCEYNASGILQCVKQAHQQGVQLVCFGELSLLGKTCGDLFLHDCLVEKCNATLQYLAEQTMEIDTIFAVGSILRYKNNLYNCAVIFKNGQILGAVPKIAITHEESRYFASGMNVKEDITIGKFECKLDYSLALQCGKLQSFKFGIIVGELLNSSYNFSQEVNVILNPNTSEMIVGKPQKNEKLLQTFSLWNNCSIISAQNGWGESTGDGVWGGHNIVVQSGVTVKQSLFGEECMFTEIDIQLLKTKLSDDNKKILKSNLQDDNKQISKNNLIYDKVDNKNVFNLPIEEYTNTSKLSTNPYFDDCVDINATCDMILQLQTRGLAKRLQHTCSKSIVLGVSGGLDSTLALIVACLTADYNKMDRKNIIAVSMPCFGTTSRTRSNAQILAEGMGVSFKEIDISKSVKSHFEDIGQDINNTDVTFENAQARERTQVIMDIANQKQGLVVGTGDLSEIALGWATYNGDHMSNYSVNCNIPKTIIQKIVRYYAETYVDKTIAKCMIDIIDTPISPELLPSASDGSIAQKTENLVGPYELHDFFLYYFMQYKFSPSKIFRLACDAFEGKFTNSEILEWEKKFFKRFFSAQFKRSCSPDGVKVFSFSLSPRGGLVIPSDANSTVWLEDLDLIKI